MITELNSTAHKTIAKYPIALILFWMSALKLAVWPIPALSVIKTFLTSVRKSTLNRGEGGVGDCVATGRVEETRGAFWVWYCAHCSGFLLSCSSQLVFKWPQDS